MKEIFFYLMAGILMLSSCNSSVKSEQNKSGNEESKAPVAADYKQAADQDAENGKPAIIKASSVNKEKEPFDQLEKIRVNDDIMIKYNPAFSEVYNKNVAELDKGDPFYPEEGGPDMGNIKLIKTQIMPDGGNYYVVFSQGPSADPSFMFYKEGETEKVAFSLSGIRLFIPGNGNVYVDGHTNNVFNTPRKLKLVNGDLEEIDQPYYYVGLKSHTVKPIRLYQSQKYEKVIASLPTNYSVEVLINKPGTDLFLVRTDFGMTGWLKLGTNKFYGNEVIKGLYYAGD